MEGTSQFERKREKPEFLYHGSSNTSIKEFIPRTSPGSGERHGERVYATPNKALASVFLCNITKPWSAGMYGNVPVAIIPISREAFIEADKGGTLYTLPSDTFEQNAELDGNEWASAQSVTPSEKAMYQSTLQAMLDNEVQVFFVTDEMFHVISESQDGGAKMLRTIQSENQLRSYNVKIF